jgi:16S rRNA (cytosine1402-N4)-methyltransferase
MDELPTGAVDSRGSGENSQQHLPVMAEVAVRLLLESGGECFVDCTVGGGGHSEALLKTAVYPIRLIGIDRDTEALEIAQYRLARWSDVLLIHGSFADLENLLSAQSVTGVNGVLADFGQSSLQLDDPLRGFSYRQKISGPLDMRYDAGGGITAAELVNRTSQTELSDILFRIGEERNARRVTAAIVRNRPIATTSELATVIRKSIPQNFATKTLARVFMALRVVVNDELNAIDRFLPATLKCLNRGGRMVFISYDSQQDRRVKQFIGENAKTCRCPPNLPVCVCGGKAALKNLTPKALLPDAAEVNHNPRSRSARLRAAEKL